MFPSAGPVSFMIILWTVSPSFAGELFRWVDEAGITHFSRSLEAIPKKYRDQAMPEKVHPENLSKGTSEHRSTSHSGVADAVVATTGIPIRKTYEVPFEPYEGDAQRVIVSVTFNESVTVPMLIDTGAPGVIISPKVAKRLELFGRNDGMVLTAAGGIGGKVTAVRTFLDTVQVGAARDVFIPVTITESISESFEGLIGMVFMSKYSFKVDSLRNVVVFEEILPDSQSPGGRSERWWRSQFKELHALRTAWEAYSSQPDLEDPDRAFARGQVNEADKLLSKLDRHASLNAVPQPWR